MVCIAAFIILCLISVIIAFLSLFKRDIGKKWWKVFKKAWHCVFKKVSFQKCDTNFKDDVKNSLLSRVVLKRPKLVKPLSVAIEILSILIVVVTVWSLIIAIKSLLALWVFGTCNVSQPSQCSLTAEACSIDAEEPTGLFNKLGRGFGEWGQIFAAIPDRLRDWNAEDYAVEPRIYLSDFSADKPYALDVVDPLCPVCMQSYKNQLSTGFMDEHNVIMLPYAIPAEEDGYKFANSGIVVRWLLAAALYEQTVSSSDSAGSPISDRPATAPHLARDMVHRLFTEYNENHVNYQTFITQLDQPEVSELMRSWLSDFGASPTAVSEISELFASDQVFDLMAKISETVETRLHAKSIPTMLYSGRKHSGLHPAD